MNMDINAYVKTLSDQEIQEQRNNRRSITNKHGRIGVSRRQEIYALAMLEAIGIEQKRREKQD